MPHRSRWLPVLLAGTLGTGLLGAPAGAAASARPTTTACPPDAVSTSAELGYGDVAGSVFEREIGCLTDAGLARGRAPGRYDPAAPVLRRQMALFLHRFVQLAGTQVPPGSAALSDIGGLDAETRSAVDAVVALDISRGTVDGRFDPDGTVTRGQMASFLDRLHTAVAGAPLPRGTDGFDDDPGSVHAASADALARAGIAAGTAVRTFSPQAAVTRGQMAGFLARLLDLEVATGAVPPVYGAGSVPLVLAADGSRCTVVGTEGDDVLRGTEGDDVLCGLGGTDRIEAFGGVDLLDGGSAADELLGGAGDDVLLGEDGDDRLLGEDGDDDLEGGPGSDLLDGGLGTNWCTPALDDVLQHCVYDQTPPEIVTIEVLPPQVDVSDADAPVVVNVHVRDDTGVTMGGLYASLGWTGELAVGEPLFDGLQLESGTRRDGIWTAVGRAPRYSGPGEFHVDVWLTDRVGRGGSGTSTSTVEVVADRHDEQAPVVHGVTLEPSSGSWPLDVREAPGHVLVTTRITDELSGVTDRSYACLHRLTDQHWEQASACQPLVLVAGDALDGTWQTAVGVEQGAASGEYSLIVVPHEGARPLRGVGWYGPEQYADFGSERDYEFRPLPDGAGRVPVMGFDDTAPPGLTEASRTPAEVETLYGDAVVELRVRAVDEGGGVTTVWGGLTGESTDGNRPQLGYVFADAPVSGTRQDGEWLLRFTLPQGTPPGRYYFDVRVEDAAHTRIWVTPGHYWQEQDGLPPLPGDTVVTVVDSA